MSSASVSVTMLLGLWLWQASGPDTLGAALSREQAGDDAGAAELLTGLSRSQPAWELPHLELARLALKQGHLDVAEFHLEVARAVAPENPRGELLNGMLLEEKQKLPAARAAYEHALLLRPEYTEAREHLGRLALAERDFPRAVEQLEAVKSKDPTQVAVRLQLAQALEGNGQVPAAEAELKALHHEQPASKVVSRRLAELYERTDRPKLAQALRGQTDPVPKRNLRTLPRSKR